MMHELIERARRLTGGRGAARERWRLQDGEHFLPYFLRGQIVQGFQGVRASRVRGIGRTELFEDGFHAVMAAQDAESPEDPLLYIKAVFFQSLRQNALAFVFGVGKERARNSLASPEGRQLAVRVVEQGGAGVFGECARAAEPAEGLEHLPADPPLRVR